ncbi:MAG TPA: NADH-quinone oxidoreductase subunit NuoE [Thermoanaerobaculales bacterium]|nr:NADH-quinone oxidoreductase subunit NuoE [Thermoanaerobaculales bacterium]HPA81235.1 NADH-quinone oxidoreductase subunit NuoE [Thermoanaerobaculales bacterium]HQL31106.1 NADH-quinone oxidoreductase subunit NuoE [Thermoanaerobaculales bacterium]HQN97063.1 NADH-quinone oxidoreductase subunit NuoE [Thermoanaerobaculales bacterium]HQP43821.1 NADH-quinone oxidoreductase subunit NuoE [Thermoanaerobaculales bacterium]
MAGAPTAPVNAAPPEDVAEVRFDAALEAEIGRILSRYPTTQAALLPVLWCCQERWGWISPGITRAVARRLGLSPASVEGVLTFYTMYHREPPGRYALQVCTTLSCQLCGAADLAGHLQRRLGIGFGETTADGRFTLIDVQCLGACGEGPVIQINNDYYTALTAQRLDELLDRLE